jgi:heme o synthase
LLPAVDRLWWRATQGLTDAALKPMRLFHWSNSYLALVFVAAAVDPLLR